MITKGRVYEELVAYHELEVKTTLNNLSTTSTHWKVLFDQMPVIRGLQIPPDAKILDPESVGLEGKLSTLAIEINEPIVVPEGVPPDQIPRYIEEEIQKRMSQLIQPNPELQVKFLEFFATTFDNRYKGLIDAAYEDPTSELTDAFLDKHEDILTTEFEILLSKSPEKHVKFKADRLLGRFYLEEGITFYRYLASQDKDENSLMDAIKNSFRWAWSAKHYFLGVSAQERAYVLNKHKKSRLFPLFYQYFRERKKYRKQFIKQVYSHSK